MTNEEALALIMAGNDAAMQWYAMTHDTQLPVLPAVDVRTPLGGVTLPSNTLLLLIGAIVVIVVFSSSRS